MVDREDREPSHRTGEAVRVKLTGPPGRAIPRAEGSRGLQAGAGWERPESTRTGSGGGSQAGVEGVGARLADTCAPVPRGPAHKVQPDSHK